ncbi:MAG: hypothetical protein AAF988_06595 [Pseudomonadota bacterium]
MPARPHHPQDKALVELSVKLFNQSILPKLRKLIFRSLDELNSWLEKAVDEYNKQPFQRRSVSRQALFERFDKPMLGPLTNEPFTPMEKACEFNLRDSHYVMVDEHFYSVPYEYAHKTVKVHVFTNAVKVYYGHKMIAQHAKSDEKGAVTKVLEHLHPKHAWFEEKPKEHYQKWADDTFADPSVAKLIGHFFDSKYIASKRGNERARKFMRFSEKFAKADVVSACRYAIKTGQVHNIDMIYSILKSEVHKDVDDKVQVSPGELIRGGEYYAQLGVRL